MTTAPSTDNYTLGKGVVYFNEWDAVNAKYKGERDLGNAPAFAFNIALEKLEHFSSRGGLKSKDKEIISQITPGITFTLDELNKDNLAMLSLATVTSVTQTGGSAVDEPVIAYKGKRINLIYREISAVVVTSSPSGTTFVNGQDYIIDTALRDDSLGRIYIPETSTITEGQNLLVDYSYGAATYTKISAFTKTSIEGRLRFVSDNPVGGNMELLIWRVSLTPSGDTSLIGDDWSTLAFSGEVLKDTAGHPTSPYMDFLIGSF